jgi:hypothetical protein
MNPPLLFSTSTTGYYYITPPTSLADAGARLDNGPIRKPSISLPAKLPFDRLLSYGTTPLAIVAQESLADLDKPASVVRAAANY